MNDNKAARLRVLTDEQILGLCNNILDGKSPGSFANVYASVPEAWPPLAEDLAYLLRFKLTGRG